VKTPLNATPTRCPLKVSLILDLPVVVSRQRLIYLSAPNPNSSLGQEGDTAGFNTSTFFLLVNHQLLALLVELVERSLKMLFLFVVDV
jgi:hypothetical protein